METDDNSPRVKGNLVSIKGKEKLSCAQKTLAKLQEIEEYLKGKGKDISYFVVITDDARFSVGVDNPAEYVGILTMDMFEFMDSLGAPDDAA